MALIVLFPFYWMLMSSVKTINEYNAVVPTLWPHQFSVGAERGIITFHRYFKSLVPSTFAARYNSLGICIKFCLKRLFLFFRKYIMRGVSRSGIKG